MSQIGLFFSLGKKYLQKKFIGSCSKKKVLTDLLESKERRHGGGWPKGKSRKSPNEVVLPKPPATG